MRVRLLVAVGLVAGVCGAVPSSAAEEKPKVLDGVKVKEITLTATGSPQAHDEEFVLGGPERVDCAPPRCAFVDFIYKPAKGVTGDLSAVASWTTPGADIDLYIAKVGKGANTDVAHCGAAAGTNEKVFVPAKDLKSGVKYRIVIDFYRVANETVTATVRLPGTNDIKNTLPDEGFGIVSGQNCSL